MWGDANDGFREAPRRVRWGLVGVAVLSGLALALWPAVERHLHGHDTTVGDPGGSVSQPAEHDGAGDIEPASAGEPGDAAEA
jgi:hypothetical protein